MNVLVESVKPSEKFLSGDQGQNLKLLSGGPSQNLINSSLELIENLKGTPLSSLVAKNRIPPNHDSIFVNTLKDILSGGQGQNLINSLLEFKQSLQGKSSLVAKAKFSSIPD